MPSGKRSEYAEATRRDLLQAARKLFAERGYQGTSLDDVVASAGVTKGALYHHYSGKKELFEAVVHVLEQEILTIVGAGPLSIRDPWEGFVAAADRYLDACLNPEIQQILLLDAPSVLGWDRWRDLENRYGLRLTKSGLEVAMEAGHIEKQPADPLAHLVLASLNEGAMYIARAEDRTAARAQVGESVRALLEGLRRKT